MGTRLFACLLAAMLSVPARAIELPDLQGRMHTLEGYRGKWVVLNVWATWCAPCISEMPELQALAQARSDVVVLGLTAAGENPQRLRQFAAALRVTYPIIPGDRKTLGELAIRAYPTTLLYNPEGKLVLTHVGKVTMRELAAQLP